MRRTEGGVLMREPVAATDPHRDTRTTKRAGWTVGAVIGLNLVLQIAMLVIFTVDEVDDVTSVRISTVVAVAFYAASAAVILAQGAKLGLVPDRGWGRRPVFGVAEGIVIGTGAAVLLSGLLRLVYGRPRPDPTTSVLAGSGALWLVLGAVVLVVVAPVVEELVFRGFLLEAFRARGPQTAVIVSAVAFAAAHLNPAQLRYYAVMGAAFALLYLRRGLVGSIAAHAAFNATLLAVALVSGHAPARPVSAAGFTVSVPATWSTSQEVAGDDLVLRGPLGTRVELAHIAAVRTVNVDDVARDVADGNIPWPDALQVDPASATRVELPTGPAVTVAARIDDRPGRVTLVPHGSRLWLATLRSGGHDGGAARAFDDILRSWRLP